jgi:1-acyl-sn-glycerol-3-phosphate acyltransferase
LGGLLVTNSILNIAGTYPIAIVVIITAIIGYLFSLKIPKLDASDPKIKIGFNTFKETFKVLKLGLQNREVFKGVLLISWFWFYGFFFLASLPSYCRDILMGDQLVATTLLAMFSIGIGLGSIICEKVAKGLIDFSLVIIGSLGLTFFAIDIYFVGEVGSKEIVTLGQFLTNSSDLRIMFDLMMIGFWGGFYIIPLYSFIQQGSDKLIRARIISVNNILNAIFMVGAAIFSIILLEVGFSIIEIFLIVSLLNFLVFIYLVITMPDHFTKLLCWILSKLFYRFKVIGSENIPISGPCVIVCNHVSFIDWMLIAGAMGRPPRFLMEKEYFEIKAIGWWFKSVKAIPIASGKIDPVGYREAFKLVEKELQEGNLVAIFPEGEITKHGELNRFRDGVLKIINTTPVPILPVALKGLWGSWFSRFSGSACKGMPSFKRRIIELRVGKTIAPLDISSDFLKKTVKQLLD